MRLFFPFALALLLASGSRGLFAETGSLDPAFQKIPFDQWMDEGDAAHMRWTAKVLPVELSNHQRLEAKIEVVIDGNELARRRGKGFLLMLVQFSDRENRLYQAHETIDLELVKEDTGKSNISYTPAAFVLPGDYRISLAIFDSATGEHSALRLSLHVNPLKKDFLPDCWASLPAVEMIKSAQSPDNLFLPEVSGRLKLPLETRRRVRVEILVNASPVAAGEPLPPQQAANRSLTNLIPALKVISQTDIRDGTMNISVLDLTTQKVIFEENAARSLDWPKLDQALTQAGPNKIDLHSLENRRHEAQFFVSQARKRIESGARESRSDALPVLIVLSGPMSFDSGQELEPMELEGKPDAKVFYIRIHSLPPREATNPFFNETRHGRRGLFSQPGRGPAAPVEPVDSLERTLKSLQPHLFDVYTPTEFRKALASLFVEMSNL